MENFNNKNALITGAANGFGLAIAKKLASHGMNIIGVDLNQQNLNKLKTILAPFNVNVSTYKCDVADEQMFKDFSEDCLSKFKNIHVLCNNAGVAPLGRIWEHSSEEIKWAADINVNGVLNGIRYFVPSMIKNHEKSRIINTASVAGLHSYANMGLYCMTKYSVVAITESLFYDLNEVCDHVKVSLLCPAFVSTNIHNSSESFTGKLIRDDKENYEKIKSNIRDATKHGKLTSEDIANHVFDAIENDKFYILTHKKITSAIKARTDNIINTVNPNY